ncbi:FtsX-like permease family protein [Candidatus Riflebacteria bacterium]
MLIHRNLLEREQELSFLRIIGYRRDVLQKLIFKEHAILFFAAIFCGLLSASIFPVVYSPSGKLPLLEMLIFTLLLLIAGIISLLSAVYINFEPLLIKWKLLLHPVNRTSNNRGQGILLK